MYYNCFLGSDVINFEINLSFLIKSFSHMAEKVRTRIWISEERKELLRWNKKHSSSFLSVLIEANKTKFFGRWESDFKRQHLIDQNKLKASKIILPPYRTHLLTIFYMIWKLACSHSFMSFPDHIEYFA